MAAFGVVLIGQVFGLLGVFVAVPILAAIGILLEELRVKPLERAAQEKPTSATSASLPSRPAS